MTTDDTRCCGTGTCMINAEDVCWCGQRWDGDKMCPPGLQKTPLTETAAGAELADKPSRASDA